MIVIVNTFCRHNFKATHASVTGVKTKINLNRSSKSKIARAKRKKLNVLVATIPSYEGYLARMLIFVNSIASGKKKSMFLLENHKVCRNHNQHIK